MFLLGFLILSIKDKKPPKQEEDIQKEYEQIKKDILEKAVKSNDFGAGYGWIG